MSNPQLDKLMERHIPMDTSQGPGQIASALGVIEDALAHLMVEHAQLKGWTKRRERFLDTYEATLYEMVDPASVANVTERKVIAKATMHEAPEYTEYLEKLQRFEELVAMFDNLDARRSIGQTILRAEGSIGNPTSHGQGQRNPAP